MRKSEQFKQLLRMNLVTGIVLYCKVLVSCRDPTYVTICKWYFKLNTLKTLLTYCVVLDLPEKWFYIEIVRRILQACFFIFKYGANPSLISQQVLFCCSFDMLYL